MIDSKKMAKIAYKALDDKKSEDIRVLDISKVSSMSDYFLITNATSLPHIQSLVESVTHELAKAGYEPRTVEGGRSSTWVLMDYIDIVIHIFTKEDRDFYDLERIWRDGTVIPSEDILREDSLKENE